MAQRDGEVIFNIFSKEIERRRNTVQENGSPKELTWASSTSSAASSQRNSWKPQLRKIKSRLRDPPEQPPCLKTDESEDDDSFYEVESDDIPDEYKSAKLGLFTLLQYLILVLIVSALVFSLWVPFLKRQKLWDLPVWKWEILVLALICGHLVSGWVIRLVVIFIERNFLLKKRVLYFVYGLRRSVQNCIWLGIVLLMWHFIFDQKIQEKTNSRILPYMTKILVCFLVGTLFWLLKTLVLKILALSFHVNNFFERIQEALFNQFVIETLSGPPMFIDTRSLRTKEDHTYGDELSKNLLTKNERAMRKSATFSRHASERQDHKIPIDRLQKLNHKNVSAWNMRRMVNTIRHGALTTLDERILNSDTEDDSSLQIKTECQAKEAAGKIFNRVAKPGSQYIYMDDLMPFMSKDEAIKTMCHFGAEAEKGEITKSALNDWVIHALRERRTLSLSLNDTKTAVDELHSMLSFIVGIIIVITSLFILGIPITHFLVFISSQLLLAVFIFGNTCKTIFEAIIFLFVVHPFDIGDRVEVDGVQLVVEEMNILTTVFMRYDNQKIIFPNSVLATKPIINYYRSPDIGDSIDFCVHVSTPLEKIATMKETIKRYVKSRSDHWHSAMMLIMRDAAELNKVRLSVWVTHRMNHQDSSSLLVEEIVKILKELGIEYWMLPQGVSNDRNFPSFNSNSSSTANWTAFFAVDEVLKNTYYASGAF